MMIDIKPCKKLLLLLPVIYGLSLVAMAFSGISLLLKIILIALLSFYSIYESLKIFALLPHSLMSLTLPEAPDNLFRIVFKNHRSTRAKLLSSSIVTSQLIILHLKPVGCKIALHQPVLRSMVGHKNFHDLLLYLKTN